MLLAILDSMVYSYNWIVGSLVISIGIVIWTASFIITYINVVPAKSLAIPVTNFCIGIWVAPFLLYWNEKRARNNAFLHWCSLKELSKWKKLLHNLPVGVLIYKGKELTFSSLSANKLLLGSMESDLPKLNVAIGDSEPLRYAIEDSTVQSLNDINQPQISQISYSSTLGGKKLLGVNTVVLGVQADQYKVCILQDQSWYEELQKERIAKEYMKKFFAMITHELRNPLQGVLGLFESLMDSLKEVRSEAEKCNMGISTAKLMMRLVNDLLDLAQLETGKFRLANGLTDVPEMVRECMELMQFKYKSKGVALTSYEKEGIPQVKCDQNRYKQILLNLLGNAIKFTEAGSVTVNVEYDLTSHKLWTTVADTGIGIRDEDKSKLFAFFGKLEDQQALNPQGAGLGLYICKKLSEAMKGTIKLESEYLKGTKIAFAIQNQTYETGDTPKEKESPSLNTFKEDARNNEMDESILEHRNQSCKLPYHFVTGTNALPMMATMAGLKEKKVTEMDQKPILIIDDEYICASVLQSYLRSCGIDADIVYIFYYYVTIM